jgi:SAM-dependent methyltransferase
VTAPPSSWIARFAPEVLPRGAVLDLAAGEGRHARLFLERGHEVTVVDRDLGGVDNLAGRPGVELVRADLEDGSPWPLGARRFAAVVVVNYLWRPLFPAILAAVGAGGWLLYETFADGQEKLGRPQNPDFLLRPAELLAVVDGVLRVAAFEEGRIEGSAGPSVRQRIAARRSLQPPPLPGG